MEVIGQDLPHIMTPAEKALMPDYLKSLLAKGITTPPGGNIRTMAEWEEVDAITITWTSYKPILAEIVRYAQQECRVIINCTDSNTVKTELQFYGVVPVNISFIIAPFNSIWIRDYGAQCGYKNDVDSLFLIDWIYNRPRPKDDTIPASLAKFTGLPLYQTMGANAIINTGGNFMTDGFGTAFSSNLILDENPGLTKNQVDSIIKLFMGIKKYVHMNNLPYDGIHHIDMHMKLLDEQTLLVGQYPSGIADGPQIEANLQYVLSNFSSVYGKPYKVVRIPMPPDMSGKYPHQGGSYCTYTNGVFVNKTYIYPTYYQQYDTTAQRIYTEALPGYKVIGINCNSIIPASGAIHCITNCVGSKAPLLIYHEPLQDLFGLKGYAVEAKIKHSSGIKTANVFYRKDTLAPFQSLPMVMTDTVKNIWEASIPLPPMKALFQYYIQAEANSNKIQKKPMTAPIGYYSFKWIPGGIEDNQAITKLLNIYPNPSKGITVIPVEAIVSKDATIELLDICGRKIKTIHSGKIPPGKSNYFINTSDMDRGTYLIKYIDNNGSIFKKLIVK